MVAGLKFWVPHFLRKRSSSKPKAFLCQVSSSDQKNSCTYTSVNSLICFHFCRT